MPTESHISHAELQQRLQTEQVLIFCRLSRVALIASVFGGLFVGYVLLVDYSLYQVLAWLTLFLATVGVRFYQQKRILAGDVAINRRVVMQLLVVIGINGLAWSLPSTIMIPREPTEQVILSLFIVGVSANSLTSLTPLRYAYTIYIVTMMAPIAALYFWIGNNYATSAIGIVAYMIFMILGGKRQTQGTEHLIRLQLENAALAENVQREKEVVERANRDLQLQIEQRERTEAELRLAKNQAETANRTKSQFLANMSHELRTPLNGVLGMSDLLLRALGNTPALQKPIKYAHTIRTSGERLLHLITDILDMARIEAGALRFTIAPFVPQRVIAEVVELTAEQLEKKGLGIAVSIAPTVPAQVLGDENRIRQILANLVSNAIKFTDRGIITINLSAVNQSVTSVAGDTQHVCLRWSVTDTGIGITPDAQKKLFQPFSQVDDSYTRKFGGTGLGLAICQELVRALGGQISVDTQPGQGATFWFELPLEVAPEPVVSKSIDPVSSTSSISGHVLIAEDNCTNAQLVSDMLELAGCKVSTAINGIEAIAKLKQESFDLVLMDWHMPEMDGVEATREWRNYERQRTDMKRAPIIALTASVLPGDRETCMQAGMDDFIAKPFTYDELMSKVEHWLPKP